jgi:guanine nucleotide-binding protein G(i) subunit alpha
MGCGMSTEDKAQSAKNKEIDEQLRREKNRLRSEIKVLLLGAGES